MLDLFVNFMSARLLPFLALIFIVAQDAPLVAITFPKPDDVLSGEVTITGSTDIPEFAFSQLDFSYVSDPTDTWFGLQTSTQPVADSSLFVWDTTLISDGDYVLRLRVFLDDGAIQEVTVPFRVQNDTPILTPTPVVTSTPNKLDAQFPTPFLVASSPTPTLTPRPTPTPLPTNSISINRTAVYTSLSRGALVVIGLFIFAGLILRFRRY